MRSSALLLTLTAALAAAEEKRALPISMIPDEPFTGPFSFTAPPFTLPTSIPGTRSTTGSDGFPTSTSRSWRPTPNPPTSLFTMHPSSGEHGSGDHGHHSTSSRSGMWGSGNGTTTRRPSGTGSVGGGEGGVTSSTTTSAGGAGAGATSGAGRPASTTRPAGAGGRLERSLGVVVGLGAAVGAMVML